jgi:hypothetical protein
MGMKIVIGSAFILVFACTCKLETSSAPNRSANANASANANRATVETASTPQAVSNCGLAMPAAPSIDGLKLRMTAPEILALFPRSDQDSQISARVAKAPSKYGESGFLITLADYPAKNKTADLTRVDVTLLDGKAYIYNFGYNGPKYPQVDDFVAKFIQGTSLPAADQWQDSVGLESQLKVLTCKDFEVRVFVGGETGNLNYVQLMDLEADKTMQDRRAKAKAQAKPSPSP